MNWFILPIEKRPADGGPLNQDSIKEPTVKEAIAIWGAPTDEDEKRRVKEGYARTSRTKILFIMFGIIALVVSLIVAVGLGPVTIGFFNSIQILIDHITGNIQDRTNDYFIWEGRLPRALLGALTGAGLAVGGCVMQSILNNNLADSYTTGISAGAGFGATIAFIAGITLSTGAYAVVINAFVFSLIPTLVILGISKLKGGSPLVMVMSGIALMYFFNAVSSVFKIMADPKDLAALYAWQLGSLGNCQWPDVILVFVVSIPCTLLLLFFTSRFNLLSFGDDYAKSMGVNVSFLRNTSLVAVTVITAILVSFTGLIGFVGLVAPHICRIVIGSDNRYLLPASAFVGAFLVVVADTFGRVAFQPYELQVGIITAFIGAPLFLYLLLRSKKTVW